MFDKAEAFPTRRPADNTPETVRLVSVPTDVMFPWAGVITDCDVGTVETFEPFTFEIPDPFETTKRPWTFRPVRVPSDVTFVWALWTWVGARAPKAMFEAFRFARPEAFEAISKPWTFRPVKVPTDVILGWDAWETTRATLALATLPTKFEEFRAYRAAPFEYTLETTRYEGKSALTRALKEGALAEPTDGPAKT